MATYFFPDNTVLINFTILDRRDILTWFTRNSGMWTLSIARECENSAQQPGLEKMRWWNGLFGDPLAPTPAEMVDARTIAAQMQSPGEYAPTAHMGEAETIAIILRRRIQAVFLTDDHAAARRAASESHIDVASTTKVLALAEVANKVRHDEARDCLATLLNEERVLGNPPSIQGYDHYVDDLKREMSRLAS
ncbi:MAG: hypothetical protein FWD75_09770 [Propionibacteriaceae bacterium]|nr:hypothetical protein [Propionibacteriaceae bacterium]